MTQKFQSPDWCSSHNLKCPECKNGGYIVHHYLKDEYGCSICGQNWDENDLLVKKSIGDGQNFNSQSKNTPVQNKIVPGY